MTTLYPPESEWKPGATFPGKAGQVGWQRFISASQQGLAPVQLHLLLEPMDESVAYGLTHVFSVGPQQAKLWFGSTGRAVVWLNGKEVVRDLVAAGLMADEISAPIKLEGGWNQLLVKVCNNWGDKWAFSASATDPSGRLLPGLRRP